MTGYPDLFKSKMAKEGLPRIVIDTFDHYYAMLCSGTSGMVPEDSIVPIPANALPAIETAGNFSKRGVKLLTQTAVLKLNGGLGTTMGLEGPKCLLEVKPGKTFLDLVMVQLDKLKERTGDKAPLVLMNSFNTREGTAQHLEKRGVRTEEMPLSFLQHKFPKVRQDDLKPAEWPINPSLEWNPPGHGNLYTAILTSGMLTELLGKGIRYLFVSNIDNVGALLDPNLLGYFASLESPFMMEVIRRTPMDRKGGHLARLKSGQLALREIAQTQHEDLKAFQDIDKHGYFNTNNLWIDITFLEKQLKERNGVLDLPMICNNKTVDPKDTTTPAVYQIETAMGSAISLFEGSQAVAVQNERYRPVKRCEDLVLLWSDIYELTDDATIERGDSGKSTPITITLDPEYYGKLGALLERFPHGVPSLKNATEFVVEGDIRFGKNVVVRGNTRVSSGGEGPCSVQDGALLEGHVMLQPEAA